MTNLWEHRLIRRVGERMGRPVEVVFTENRVNLLSVSSIRPNVRLRIHRMFAFADDEVLDDLVQFVLGKKGSSGKMLDAFIRREGHLARAASKSSGKKIRIRVKGKRFHLTTIFKKLNGEYFDGKLDCKITWGKMPPFKKRWSIRLGSFVEEDRLIRIHPLLDREEVPEEYIESVVHHEMIHAHVGISGPDSRRTRHGDEFRSMERKFIHHRFAKEWEKRHIRKLLSPLKNR